MGKTRKETLAYGAWKSPLTADFVSGASKGLAGAALDSEGHLIWLEGRPSESGLVTRFIPVCFSALLLNNHTHHVHSFSMQNHAVYKKRQVPVVFALNLLYPNLGLLPPISCFGSVTKFNTLLLVSDFVSFMTFVYGEHDLCKQQMCQVVSMISFSVEQKMRKAHGQLKNYEDTYISIESRAIGNYAMLAEFREFGAGKNRRAVLVREGADTESPPIDITPAGFNVRTTVHEYGGGAFTMEGDTVIFSNYVDQRLYKQSLVGGKARAQAGHFLSYYGKQIYNEIKTSMFQSDMMDWYFVICIWES